MPPGISLTERVPPEREGARRSSLQSANLTVSIGTGLRLLTCGDQVTITNSGTPRRHRGVLTSDRSDRRSGHLDEQRMSLGVGDARVVASSGSQQPSRAGAHDHARRSGPERRPGRQVPREQRVETVDAAWRAAPDGFIRTISPLNEFDAIVFARIPASPIGGTPRPETPGLGSNDISSLHGIGKAGANTKTLSTCNNMNNTN